MEQHILNTNPGFHCNEAQSLLIEDATVNMSTSYSNGKRFPGWERETDLTGTWYGPFTEKNIAAAARSLFLLFCTRLQRGPAGLGNM